MPRRPRATPKYSAGENLPVLIEWLVIGVGVPVILVVFVLDSMRHVVKVES